MSTYVMSDIHGQLEAFNEMLDKIQFKVGDNSPDKLYILGDYVDWGDSSIDLLLKIIEMSKTNTECLIGNHDLMMYKVISKKFESVQEAFGDADFYLWASNLGDETFMQYLEQDKETRNKIKIWISQLRYFIPDLIVNNKKYYLCHSKPFIKGMKLEDVVWQRIEKEKLPMTFKRKFSDTTLISGHTIVKNYSSFDKDGKLVIYHDKKQPYINIDCGAKALKIRSYSRLACLRLEDMAEFYVK